MARKFSKKFYRSKAWEDTRRLALMRDNYLCCRCGQPAEEVHHKVRLSPSNMEDINVTLNIDNLECLCKECHFAEHKIEKIRAVQNKNDCDNEYEFDENGFLVKK